MKLSFERLKPCTLRIIYKDTTRQRKEACLPVADSASASQRD
jgi:hypothetical protein